MNIEPLESRIAPAKASIVFTAPDGDIIKVEISAPGPLIPADVDNAVSRIESPPGSGTFQLVSIELTDVKFQGASVSITATPDPVTKKGDGFERVGSIDANGRDLGTVKVDGGLGQIIAGDADAATRGLGKLEVQEITQFNPFNTSTIFGDLGSLKVAGSVSDASLFVSGNIGPIEIGDTLVRSNITATGKIKSVSIKGDFLGGDPTNNFPGLLQAKQIGTVTIGGNLFGGDEDGSGRIISTEPVDLIRIGGGVFGAEGDNSGQIFVGGVKQKITVGGDVKGGLGEDSGSIQTTGNAGKVFIEGSVKGGEGKDSGIISSTLGIKGIKIGGSLEGGDGVASGVVASFAKLDSFIIGGNVAGGVGNSSGLVFSVGDIKAGRIGGSVEGGLGDATGGVACQGVVFLLNIGRDLVGGDVTGTDSLARSGFIESNRIVSVSLGGSIYSGENTGTGAIERSGSIGTVADIGTLTIRGSLIGNASNPVIISAGHGSVAIKKLTIGGSLDHADILAGYNPITQPVDGDAEIGAVSIGGSVLSSNIVAGVIRGGDGFFGTLDDAAIDPSNTAGATNDAALFSTIGRITIKGQAQGDFDPMSGEHFGIVAGRIAGIVTAGRSHAFTLAPGDDVIRLGSTSDPLAVPPGDFFAREDVGS